jgi:hypothetical protein
MYNLLKHYGELENLNRPVTSKVIESAIKVPSTKKIPGHDSFWANSIKYLYSKNLKKSDHSKTQFRTLTIP